MRFPPPRRFSTLFLALNLFFTLLVYPDLLSAAAPNRIIQIDAKGLSLIDKGTIFSTIQSHIGGELTQKQVSQDIQALFELGFFADIDARVEKTSPKQYRLIFHFKEKPRIRKLRVKGVHKIGDKKYQEALQVFEKNMLDLSRVRTDLQTFKQMYREKGLYNTEINYTVTPAGKGWVDLTYVIQESPKIYLTEIKITGSKFYYPLDIERLMQSAEVDCFSWVNDSGVYFENKINADLQIIAQAYMKEGFIKVQIDKPKVTLVKARDFNKVIVELHIEEGARYYTNKLEFHSEDGYDLLFKPKEQLEKLQLKKGEPFNPFKEQKDQFNLNQIYLEQGYAFARVRAVRRLDEKTKKVNVAFLATRKHKAYIGRVDIRGNYETQDYVVRRELEIHDNELFNGVKLRESMTNINRLGYFEARGGIGFERERGSNENEINYDINLYEAQTGTFSANLSYSALRGMALQFSLSKKNFYGTGKTLRLSLQKEQRGDTLFNFSMVNPYFFDTEAINSFSLFRSYVTDPIYSTRATGVSLGWSYPLWKKLYGSARYGYKRETYENISEAGVTSLRGAEFNIYQSMRFGLIYNTVDNPMFPSEGGNSQFFVERFGGPFGGTIDYQSTTLVHSQYQSFNADQTIVGMARFSSGILTRTSSTQEIPLLQRYRKGGITSMRGYDYYEMQGATSQNIGTPFSISKAYPYQGDFSDCAATPGCSGLSNSKDPNRIYWEEHIGGNLYRILNLELLFPLTREGKNVRGVFFYDIGNVWSEDRLYRIRGIEKDLNNYRRSAGFGVRFITPMGVIRFEYGAKLDKQPRESPSKFEFNIGGLF